MSQKSQILLKGEDIIVGYDGVEVLHQVSFSVKEHSISAMIGSNGAGKTTTMRAIAGLLPLDSGTLYLRNVDIASLPTNERVDIGISLVPEGRLIFSDLSVEENLRLGAYTRRARPHRDRLISEMYALFPVLKERRRQNARSLSGGEQQMLALARGLMAEPSLLLLDEPSLGLAPKVVAQLFDVMRTIREAGVTVFIVEQNVRQTLELADYAWVLENGRVIRQGAARDLLHNAEIKAAYLGI